MAPPGRTDGARYHRQRILAEVGESGQARLAAASALVVGLGGLGSPAALYLAAAGVGRLGLIDDQVVELSNLQRQVLHRTDDLAMPKVESAAGALRRLNPDVVVEAMRAALAPEGIDRLLGRYDIVLDGSDNFETRFLVSDACVFFGRPFVHGAVIRWQGQLFTYAPGSACLRCIFREPPPPEAEERCEEAGIMGAVAGVVGSWMAGEALKVLLQAGKPLTGRLLTVDALNGACREVPFARDPACPACGVRPAVTDWSAYGHAVTARGHLAR